MRKTKHFALVLFVILCCLTMGSCGRTVETAHEETVENVYTEAPGDKAAVVTASNQKFSVSYEDPRKLTIVLGAEAENNSVYLWGCNFQNEITTYWITCYDNTETPTEQQLITSEEGCVMSVDVSTDAIYYLERIDYEDGSTSWFLHGSGDVNELKWASETSALSQMVIVQDKAYLVDGNQLHVCMVDTGAYVNTIVVKDNITQLIQIKNQGLMLYFSKTGELFFEADIASSNQQAIKLPEKLRDGTIVSGVNSEYDCLVIGKTALYGWNIGATEAIQILSFDTCGLVSTNLSGLVCVGNGSFLGATWRSGEPKDRLFWINPVSSTPEKERTLRIAGLSRPMVMSAAISDFKALCPEYSVEYVDYAELYGDQALQRLQNDLLLGTAPDLLLVNGLPVEAYINRGMLENLYEWIDKDSELNRNEFTQNLLDALEAYDGQLYKLPQSYSIVTTMGTQSLAGGKEDWTYADINKLMERNDNLLSVFYGEPKESLAVTLLLYMINSFVDYENAISHFDSTEMVEYLKFLNNIVPREQWDYLAENELDALRNGEVLFAQLMLTSPQMFAELNDTYDEPFVYPGYPNAGGAFYLNLPMAIPVASAEKDGAWKFMKMLFSSEYFSTRGGWLPLQASFEMSLKNACANGASKGSMEQLAKIQERIEVVTYYDEAVSNIVLDEISYMFGGVRTEQETASQIHDRVQLYLSEQYVSQNG